jgi:hypothetical protein
MSRKVTPAQRLETGPEVGGPIDTFNVALAVYGLDLEPDEISKLAHLDPTTSHRRGECRKQGGVPFPSGAWIRSVKSDLSASPSESVIALLSVFPKDPALWRELNSRFDVQIRVGIHTSGWNRGFALSQAALALIALTGARMEFDLYMYGDEDSAESTAV